MEKTEIKDKQVELKGNIWYKKIVYNLPLYIYLPMLILILTATFTGNLPNNMVGATAFLLLVAGGLVFVGDRIPIWKDWIGGGLIFCLVVGGIISYYHVLPEKSYNVITAFYYKPTNMLVWCVAALIAGSILSMPRTYLIKALPLYIPSIFGGLIFSCIFVFAGASIAGYGGIKGLLTVVLPIEGGGLGAGAIPISQIYANATGMEVDQVFSMIIPAVVIGNVVAIIIASLLYRIGEMKPNLSGNGVLMPKERWMPSGGIKKVDIKLTNETIMAGWTVAVSFLVIGYALRKIVPIHYFAIMIILTALVKILNILPDDIEQSAGHFYKFVATGFYGPLLLGVGLVHFKLDVLLETITPTYLVLAILAVAGAAFGAAIIGRLFGLYPIESALTGGLCMANMGGSGDIAVLAAARRIELMPFAQISSRIGGAIMLIIAQLAIGIWSHYL